MLLKNEKGENVNIKTLHLTAKAFRVVKQQVIDSENYSVEFVILAGLKHLLGLKNYYETHQPVNAKALKAEIEMLKAELAKK